MTGLWRPDRGIYGGTRAAAVVGGGIFGCVTAITLARAGHQVDLYERHGGLMYGASRANQGRLHLGYHYPRCQRTADTTRRAAGEFTRRFPAAVTASGRHYYALAAEGSRTSVEDYLAHCDRLSAPYQVVSPSVLRRDTVATCVRVAEQRVDLAHLRGVLHQELRTAGVRVRLGAEVDPERLDHDHVVLATYGRHWPDPLRYELCETAVIRLGAHFAGLSLVVMDGAFCSLDPLPGTGLHMLYDVDLSVHAVGDRADFAAGHPGLDRGLIPTSLSRVDQLQASLRRFVHGVGMPEYVGSLVTVRAVLPGTDDTDARPTLVRRDGRVVHLLAGKISTAVQAARQVATEIDRAVTVA